MYRLKIKEATLTIPKASIRILAMQKAMDLGELNAVKLDTNENAVNYLKSIGIEVIK